MSYCCLVQRLLYSFIQQYQEQYAVSNQFSLVLEAFKRTGAMKSMAREHKKRCMFTQMD
ncbi:hypothetical protein QO004_001707 [Rhizobium mesoamericanum]|nr:hypothetical protein [Rhizobium mesoamericanum]